MRRFDLGDRVVVKDGRWHAGKRGTVIDGVSNMLVKVRFDEGGTKTMVEPALEHISLLDQIAEAANGARGR